MIKGTHGTCTSNADSIMADMSFRASTVGLRGAGAYFWGYHSDEAKDDAKELAVCWWGIETKRGNYSKSQDKRCSVIYVDFTIENKDVEVLDITEPEINETFRTYSKKVLDRVVTKDANDVSQVYDMFISLLEEKAKRNFKLIHARVQSPGGYDSGLPKDVAGTPSCYIARDTSCVNIKSREVVI
tara:strand:- start:4441 stop:4995 length:555 start_codon:yes stop_codon:yes gene_type:complete